jgi:hypothetical protein
MTVMAIPEIHPVPEMLANFTGKGSFKSLNQMQDFIEPGYVIIHGRRVLSPSRGSEMSKALV